MNSQPKFKNEPEQTAGCNFKVQQNETLAKMSKQTRQHIGKISKQTRQNIGKISKQTRQYIGKISKQTRQNIGNISKRNEMMAKISKINRKETLFKISKWNRTNRWPKFQYKANRTIGKNFKTNHDQNQIKPRWTKCPNCFSSPEVPRPGNEAASLLVFCNPYNKESKRINIKINQKLVKQSLDF